MKKGLFFALFCLSICSSCLQAKEECYRFKACASAIDKNNCLCVATSGITGSRPERAAVKIAKAGHKDCASACTDHATALLAKSMKS